jgi:hypothetical protein
LASLGRYYLWFVIVVAGLAGLPRLILSRRFAELQHAKFQQKTSIMRSPTMSWVIVVLAVIFSGLYFTPWGHQGWIRIAIVFSLLSAGEYFFQARYTSIDALTFQNRLLGILYLGVAAGSYIMLLHL